MDSVPLVNRTPPPRLSGRIFPESLRWLLATRQYCRSKWIMGHIAAKNRVNLDLDSENILAGKKIRRRVCVKRFPFYVVML